MDMNGYSGTQMRVAEQKGDRDNHGYPLWDETADDKIRKTDGNSRGESEGYTHKQHHCW